MLNRILIALFLSWLLYATGILIINYHRIYLSHKKAAEQLALQKLEQEKINKMSVPEIIEYASPKNASTIKKLAYCESTYNPKAIHYNDGGVGKHSIGILQYQPDTWTRYTREMGVVLNRESTLDQIKVSNYVVENYGTGDWYNCSKKLGML